MLQSAVDVLAAYDFVGIYEDFQMSVDAMCWRFGWPAPATIPWVNRAFHRLTTDDLEPRVRNKLRDLTALDSELYERGVRLFTERKRAMMRHVIDLAQSRPIPDVDQANSPRPDSAVARAPSNFGDKAIEILKVEIMCHDGPRAVLQSGETGRVVITALAREAVDDVTVGIAIRTASQHSVFGTNSYHLQQAWATTVGVHYQLTFEMTVSLNEGDYFVTAALHAGPSHLRRCHHWWEDAVMFQVLNRGVAFDGLVDLAPTLTIREFSSGRCRSPCWTSPASSS